MKLASRAAYLAFIAYLEIYGAILILVGIGTLSSEGIRRESLGALLFGAVLIGLGQIGWAIYTGRPTL